MMLCLLQDMNGHSWPHDHNLVNPTERYRACKDTSSLYTESQRKRMIDSYIIKCCYMAMSSQHNCVLYFIGFRNRPIQTQPSITH